VADVQWDSKLADEREDNRMVEINDASAPEPLLLTRNEYLYFIDRALDGMAAILAELGDERANQRPDLPRANTPFAIVTHCLGVAEYWAGHLVAGRTVVRDRDAEFTAAGAVNDLLRRLEAAKRQLRSDVALADPRGALRESPPPAYLATRPDITQGAALQHVYEELARHHGHLEITRDLLEGP
jgi:hypothetical protein